MLMMKKCHNTSSSLHIHTLCYQRNVFSNVFPGLCVYISQLAPENTLMSFQRALQMNVTGLEADVTIRYTHMHTHANTHAYAHPDWTLYLSI
jgi:hypothetical protein